MNETNKHQHNHHSIPLYAFMGVGDEPVKDEPVKKEKREAQVRKVRTRTVSSAGDTGFLDECFENEEKPSFTTDENIELHRVLMEQSCNDLHEAFENKDYMAMRDILSWIRDDSWEAFSFLVCAAIVDIDPVMFRDQISMRMNQLNISKELLCLH